MSGTAKALRSIATAMGLSWDAAYRRHVFDTLNKAADELERANATLSEIRETVTLTAQQMEAIKALGAGVRRQGHSVP